MNTSVSTKITKSELITKQSKPLYQKVLLSQELIRDFYDSNDGKVIVSVSGGKDSYILLHLVRSIYPGAKAVFCNTTNERKEILNFVRSIDNVDKVFPSITFKKFVEKKGFPLVSKECSQKIYELKHTKSSKLKDIRLFGYQNHPTIKDGSGKLPNRWHFLAEQKFDVTNKCCYYLKKKPLNDYCKKHNVKPFIGLMSDESQLRMQLSLYNSIKIDKSYPLLYTGWTEKDIWDYAKINNLTFASCYYDRTLPCGTFIEAEKRTGCKYCGFGLHLKGGLSKFEKLKLLEPKSYIKHMNLTHGGVRFSTAIDLVLSSSIKRPRKN